MLDSVAFHLEQIVYFVLTPDRKGMVTGIIFRPNGVKYLVSWAPNMCELEHYRCELTDEAGFTE